MASMRDLITIVETKLMTDGRLDEKEKSLKSDNPCWKGYHPVGTKEKDGKTVPNCVPDDEAVDEGLEAFDAMEISDEAPQHRANKKKEPPRKTKDGQSALGHTVPKSVE